MTVGPCNSTRRGYRVSPQRGYFPQPGLPRLRLPWVRIETITSYPVGVVSSCVNGDNPVGVNAM